MLEGKALPCSRCEIKSCTNDSKPGESLPLKESGGGVVVPGGPQAAEALEKKGS